MPLYSEPEELDVRFPGRAETVHRYRIFGFAQEKGPVPKPALLRTEKGGASFYVELCKRFENNFSRFIARL